MFRSNKSHLISMSHRLFCTRSQPEKCYIIKTSDNAGKKVIYESQIMQRFRDQQKGVVKVENYWKRMIQIVEQLLKKGKQEATVIVRYLKIDEKLLVMKKTQAEKLHSKIEILKKKFDREKLKEIPGQVNHQFGKVQASDGYKKALGIPRTILQHSKSSVVKAHHYWGIFMESEAKEKLGKIVRKLWINGKLFISFIREAYFENSNTKALPKR
jgi:hypothetical protein